ncbi:lysophospholipid acyltransferase family protein [Chromobacterium vaccinii]|uniref:lysophospholipid acyltransferase family protein n=1 Tax=Chromobacterium vaccinii TaxID=1108595 RepID=UPI003C72E28A
MIQHFKTLLRSGIRRLLLPMFRVEVTYCQPAMTPLLERSPCLVVANHVSLLDGVLIALTSPTPLAFAVDTDYSRKSRISKCCLDLLAWLGFGDVIPMDSGSPFGMRTLMRLLKDGQSVMIFPEGRISADGHPGVIQAGMKWLLTQARVPVVPISINGAERSRIFAKAGRLWWPRIQLLFGVNHWKERVM